MLKPAPWPVSWPCCPADMSLPQQLVHLQLDVPDLLEAIWRGWQHTSLFQAMQVAHNNFCSAYSHTFTVFRLQ